MYLRFETKDRETVDAVSPTMRLVHSKIPVCQGLPDEDNYALIVGEEYFVYPLVKKEYDRIQKIFEQRGDAG